MFVQQIRIESLGNSSYLVGSEEAKTCVVIDPLRDVDLYTQEADRLGVKIVGSLETHVHNDFISGSRELAQRNGAWVGASAAGGLLFEHRPLRKGDSVEVGEVRLDVLETPGHTPEHISFLATDTTRGGGPHALFSGGALLVGGVARSDLLGKQLTPFLGRWFYRTILQELRTLDDQVTLYPTHGGGSFCMAAPAGSNKITSSIGEERLANPYFQTTSEEEFLSLAQADLPSVPSYYKRMANINRRGPRILGGIPDLYPLAPMEAWVRVKDEDIAVDSRSSEEYAASHIPGAYSVPYGNSFSTWVGWLIEAKKSLMLLADDPATREDMVRQLIRIGYDTFEGYLEGGMKAWEEAKLPIATLQTITAGELYKALESGHGPTPLDVRFGNEWHQGHVPEALHVELGDLPEHVDGLPRDRSYAMVCAAGVRAATAASVMEREGFADVSLLLGGTEDWRKAGYPLEVPK